MMSEIDAYQVCSELNNLTAVAAALISPDGDLIQSNEGFLRLLPLHLNRPESINVRFMFIQPTFENLKIAVRHGESNQPLHSGLITLGDIAGNTYCLRGSISMRYGKIWLLAEHDIEELDRLYASSLSLTAQLNESQRDLAKVNRQVRKLSQTDPLTGLANRRRLEDYLSTEISRCERNATSFVLAEADLDHFKHFNDTYGHDIGDLVLSGFARLVQPMVRSNDLVARHGGEEFIIVLSQTSIEEGESVLERIRTELESHSFDNVPIGVTASFGLAEWKVGESISDLLKRADEAMYEAKISGRNRVVVSD